MRNCVSHCREIINHTQVGIVQEVLHGTPRKSPRTIGEEDFLGIRHTRDTQAGVSRVHSISGMRSDLGQEM